MSGSTVDIKASCLCSCLVKAYFVYNWITSYQITSASKKIICSHEILEVLSIAFCKVLILHEIKRKHATTFFFHICKGISFSKPKVLLDHVNYYFEGIHMQILKFFFICVQRNYVWSVIIFPINSFSCVQGLHSANSQIFTLKWIKIRIFNIRT